MSLSAIVDTTTYTFGDAVADAAHFLGFDGWGMGPVNLITEQGPLQHGLTYLDVRLEPRPLTLLLGLKGSSWDDLFNKRQALLDIFKPRVDGQVIKLNYQVNSKEYQIDTRYAQSMGLGSNDIEGFYQKVAITLIAVEPTWYNPAGVAITYGVAAGGGNFSIPLPIPWPVGSSVIDETKTINNLGTWLSYPVIRLVGPLTNPVITNLTTGDKLDFTGLVLASAEERVIDLSYGQKTVVDEDGNNAINDLTNDSDLTTFVLLPGGNDIAVEGTAGDASTEVYISYYERFVGI